MKRWLLIFLLLAMLTGGVKAAGSGFTITITVAQLGPTVGGIYLRDLITGNTNYTNQQIVTLEAYGITGTPTEMARSESSIFTGATWEIFLNPATNELSAGDGTKTVYYKVQDVSLRQSPTVEGHIVLDTVSPDAPVLIAPIDNSYTNEARPLFSWNPAADATSGVGSYEIIIATATLDAIIGETPNYRPDVSLIEGLHTWKIRAKDRAQNWGVYSLTWNVTVDVTAPIVTLGAPLGGESIGAWAAQFPITWEASDNYPLAEHPIAIDFSSDSGGSWSNVVSDLDNSGTYLWTVNPVTATTCRVRVKARDRAGNIASAASSDFTINAVSPEGTLLSVATGLPISAEVVIRYNEAMNTASVDSRLTISPEVTETITWSADSRTLTFTHSAPFDYFTNYQIVVAAGAVDLYNNPTVAQSFNFRTVSRDEEKPEIIVKIAGRAIQSKDSIGRQPEFKVTITDNVELDPRSPRIYFNGTLVTHTVVQESARLIELSYTPAELDPGQYSLRVEAADLGENPAVKDLSSLTVATGATALTNMAVYPQTFSPAKAQGIKIAYNLNKDADTRIMIYSVSGELAWDARFSAGTNGGLAGYNEVTYDGRSAIHQTTLGNGIYVGTVVADGKVVGRFKIVVYD